MKGEVDENSIILDTTWLGFICLVKMCSLEKFVNGVFYVLCYCCGKRQYGGRKKRTPDKKLKDKLLNHIISWAAEGELERERILRVLVIGPRATGKSSFIRSLQSICIGKIIPQDIEAPGNANEQLLYYKGRQLPIVLCEYPALCVDDNNVHDDIVRTVTGSMASGRQSCISDGSSDPIQAVIFVENIENIPRTMTAELMNQYTPLASFLRNNDIPYCVVLTHVDEMEKEEMPENTIKQNIQVNIGYAQVTFEADFHDVFPVKCYTTEQRLVPTNDAHLLKPLSAILEHVGREYTFEDPDQIE